MRVYQIKHYEVLLNDHQPEGPVQLYHYELLCGRLLTLEALASSNVIEIAHIPSSRMEQRPVRIERVLNARNFPPFYFVIAKN